MILNYIAKVFQMRILKSVVTFQNINDLINYYFTFNIKRQNITQATETTKNGYF